jgi:cell division transport system ATP-binding protein
VVKFKHVSKYFGQIKALEDISFEVKDGEFVFLTGPSGAGKTTILRLLLREILPDKGEIYFGNQNVVVLKKEEIPLLRQKIGVVFQDYKLLPERTVRENVEVALAVGDKPQGEWKPRVDRVLKLVGLLERAELFPSQLSGGELQRASLARALVVQPKLILADEPTGNLDWETADAIMNLFEIINKEGMTIIMATHNKEVIEKHKKRVIKLKAGKMAGENESKEGKEEREENKHEEKKETNPLVEEKVEKKDEKKEEKMRIRVEEV